MKTKPEKQLSHSQAMVKKYTTAIKRSTTCLKRWEKRLRYYERRVQESRRSDIGRTDVHTRKIVLEELIP